MDREPRALRKHIHFLPGSPPQTHDLTSDNDIKTHPDLLNLKHMPKSSKKSQERKVSVEPANDNYVYQPLNEAKQQVRIFRLAPGKFDHHIKGSLIIISLDKLRRRKWADLRQWTALSYVWGFSNRDVAITVSRRKIFVTSSLGGALQYRRHQYFAEYLWIDQICINQDDTAERGSQVTLMRNIYAQATCVVAWLGPPAEEIENNELESLLEMMRSASPILKSTIPDYAKQRRDGKVRLQEKELLTDIVRLHGSDESLEQVINTLCKRLENFFNEAWFKRVWTLQEAVLAVRLVLQVGWTHATWDDIVEVCIVPGVLEPDICDTSAFRGTFFSMFSLRKSAKPPGGQDPPYPWTGIIFDLVRVASDDRDYVYGQLGLFNRRVMEFLTPDYSARVESVFISGTLALIKADENLDALGTCCAGCKPGKYLLPSWCRDWSDGGSGCGIRDDGEAPDRIGLYKAASKYHPQITNQFHDSVACVRGVIIDEIGTEIFKGSMVRDSMGEETNFVDAWGLISRTFLHLGRLSAEDGRSQSLFRTLINDTFNGVSRADAFSILQAIGWLQDATNGKDLADLLVPSKLKGDFSVGRMVGQLQRVANRNRSLFETTGHRFGRSCKHVLPGDKICLLYGGRLPFILRKAGTVNLAEDNDELAETQAYQLIGGECYVHGLVDGEGLEGIADGDPRVQDICLI